MSRLQVNQIHAMFPDIPSWVTLTFTIGSFLRTEIDMFYVAIPCRLHNSPPVPRF